MKFTGIVRRVDDLGRIVIPKEVRKTCGIYEGDPLEIFTDKIEGKSVVCFRKYEPSPLSSLNALANSIDNEMIYNATDEERDEVQKYFNEIAKILKECKMGIDK